MLLAESNRVGPYHDRVQRHADKISSNNGKLISYTDKGLGSTLAVCAGVEWSSHSEKLCISSHSPHRGQVFMCPALLLRLLMSCRGEVCMPCCGEVLMPCRGENFNALSW